MDPEMESQEGAEPEELADESLGDVAGGILVPTMDLHRR